MRILLIIFFFFLPAAAMAVCTASGPVGTGSVQVVPAQDIKPRSYVLIENSGQTNPMWVCIGSNNTCNATGIFLKPGASWLLLPQPQAIIPSGDIAVVSAGGGTSYAFCDY